MTRYHAHLESMTVQIETPRGRWWITEQELRLLTLLARHTGPPRTKDGPPHYRRRWTQRQLALLTGYSLGGLSRALRSLDTGGIIARMTRRGRYGWTLAQVKAGTRVLLRGGRRPNVRGQGTARSPRGLTSVSGPRTLPAASVGGTG